VTGGVAIAEVADRLAIQGMFARWGMAFDEGRSDVVRSLFTQDAEFSVLSGEYRTDPNAKPPSASGKDAIVALVAKVWSQQGDQRRHLLSNIIIEKLSRNEATADAYALVAVAGHRLEVSVVYTCNLRREADGAWRFSRMVIGMDTVGGGAPPAAVAH
jgi:hypothetical protein